MMNDAKATPSDKPVLPTTNLPFADLSNPDLRKVKNALLQDIHRLVLDMADGPDSIRASQVSALICHLAGHLSDSPEIRAVMVKEPYPVCRVYSARTVEQPVEA